MKKFLTALALMMAMTSNHLKAQKSFYPARIQDEAKINNGIVIGIKSGMNCPRLYYTNNYLADLPHDFMIGVSASAFIEFPFLKVGAIAPEFNYQQRGGATSYIYE